MLYKIYNSCYFIQNSSNYKMLKFYLQNVSLVGHHDVGTGMQQLIEADGRFGGAASSEHGVTHHHHSSRVVPLLLRFNRIDMELFCNS